ncbi:MAG: phosphotransferase family protein [Alphaproteobacteria bacterium]
MSDNAEKFSGTMEVREQHRIDGDRLRAYMREHVDGYNGEPLDIEQFKGGQSCPTYSITAGGKAYVLRRKPPGKLLPSAHAVDREYKVITGLADTDVPVPRTFCLCEDEAVVGTAFYIMERVDGRVFWDPMLKDLAKPERGQVYDQMNAAIAALHQVDYEVVGLGDFGRPGNYFARQIGRWSKQYKASETESIPEMDRLIEYLPASIPAGDETSLVHGDYRLDNMIFHPTEPRLLAVLDWELSTLGHPLADFSYHLMVWRLSSTEFRGIADADFAGLGLPTEDEYVAAYCRRTGRERVDNLEWYLAYNMFRLSAILQGIMGRVVDGTAASEHAIEQGKRARPLAEAAWRQVEAIAK